MQALGYSHVSFTVPREARITGEFEAHGGRDDIEVVIFDEAGFYNYQKRERAARVYYSSHGYVSGRRRIDKNLPAGSYVIVFNNRNAILTDKTVFADIEVE